MFLMINEWENKLNVNVVFTFMTYRVNFFNHSWTKPLFIMINANANFKNAEKINCAEVITQRTVQVLLRMSLCDVIRWQKSGTFLCLVVLFLNDM